MGRPRVDAGAALGNPPRENTFLTGDLVSVRAARDLLAYFFLDVLGKQVDCQVLLVASNARRFPFLRKGSKLARQGGRVHGPAVRERNGTHAC